MNRSILLAFLVVCCLYPCRLPALEVVSEPEYEEIFVFMRVQGVGSFEINALYSYENDQLLLPVAELFQYLRINHKVSRHLDSISGFLIDEEKRYLVDHTNKQIQNDGTSIPLKEGELIKTDFGLYLNTGVFGKAFGLFCTFHFRSLSVELKTDLELPAIRELRLEQMRKNIERLRGEVEVDTTIYRYYNLFRFGMVEWGISSTQINGQESDTRASLGIGSELLGGETNIYFNYSTRDGFNDRNQHYLWRWANNNTKAIKQIRIGKISTGSISSIYNPVLGFTATNAPTTFRRSFGEYILTDFTEPGWTVELYINNVIVDYITADASGFFSFDVPMVYGTSQVVLKFYGPYGEERIQEQYLNIPYNFLPTGELEYILTGGMVQDGDQSIYSRAAMNYGVNRFLTVGGGMEYLSSISTGAEIPFISASVTPFNNMMLSGEYAYGVRTRALFSYRLPSNLMFELDYANYEEEQQAIRFNYLEERKAMLAIPLRFSKFKGFTRLSFRQNIYENLNYNTADMTFSTYVKGISANLSAYASWIDQRTPFVYSNLALGMRLGRGFTLRPQAQLDVSNKELISIKTELEKKILRSGYLSVSYEENIRMAYRSIDFSFRWDLSFTQTSAGARITKDFLTTSQGARGSLAFGGGNNYIHIDNRSSIGRGGLTIIPFLDINHNGIRDKDEPLASGLEVRINGGRIIRTLNDTLIRVIELEPYASYMLELDESGLGNIAWHLRDKVLSIYIDPNQFKKLEIPVLPMGEVNGMIALYEDRTSRGLGRILVNFYKADGTFVKKIMSESDGYLTYLGLSPGNYYARVDSVQIQRLGLQTNPERIDFEIEALSYGDIVDGLNFTLHRIVEGSANLTEPVQAEELQTVVPDHEVVISPDKAIDDDIEPQIAENEKPDGFDPNRGVYYVQAGAFITKQAARVLKIQLMEFIPLPSGIVLENGLFKLRFGYFKTQAEAFECFTTLQNRGINSFQGRIGD
jgi:hypothetical protein